MKDTKFNKKLNETKKRVMAVFEEVCYSFSGNETSENHQKIVQKLLSAYKVLK